ncbi:glycosyltransferase family 2 protein [Candidatus Parcubacteria bacterium]|nr:glycosyltransferase family 2 protein [Candidatus Parcubacteria bacterium]
MISIIIVNYNGKKWLKKCLDSLFSQTYKNFEIVFVDNDSSDDSVDFIKKNYPKVRIVQSDRNLGFAGGNNLGISESKGDIILLLSNDTWVENDFLKNILSYFEEHNFDVVGVLQSEYERKEIKIRNSCSRIDPTGASVVLPKKDNEEHFSACGCCLLFKKNLYEKTRGLDGRFFMYFEETDWCWRLHLFGKKVGIAENTFIYHASSGSTGPGLKYLTFLWRNQNIPQMLLKNYSWYNLLWTLPLYVIQNIFEIIFFLVNLKFKIAWSYFEGWVFIVKNFKGIMKEREWVQRNRKVSDYEIMKKFFYWGPAKLHFLISFYKEKKKLWL